MYYLVIAIASNFDHVVAKNDLLGIMTLVLVSMK